MITAHLNIRRSMLFSQRDYQLPDSSNPTGYSSFFSPTAPHDANPVKWNAPGGYSRCLHTCPSLYPVGTLTWLLDLLKIQWKWQKHLLEGCLSGFGQTWQDVFHIVTGLRHLRRWQSTHQLLLWQFPWWHVLSPLTCGPHSCRIEHGHALSGGKRCCTGATGEKVFKPT